LINFLCEDNILGKVLDSLVDDWKKKGLDDDPFFQLLLDMATHYADDADFDSLLERTITEAPLCTCKSLIDDQLIGPQLEDSHLIRLNYRGSHPLLHDEECPLHFGPIQIVPDDGAN